jgi:N-acyl-L-homoserine lactone synthetase
MQNITFDFLGQHRCGSSFHEYLHLRKAFFVDHLGWEIPHNDDVEMDQYDNPCAHYSLVVRRGKVLGGARIMPTTARWGSHTYMLRDALRGNLHEIPANAIPHDIASPLVWECSRLVVDHSATTPSDRAQCLWMIVEGLVDIAAHHGADELVTLTRVSLLRPLRQLGFAANRLGEAYRSGDGLQYAVLSMPVTRSSHRIAAE